MRKDVFVVKTADALLQPPRQFRQRQALRQFEPVSTKGRRQTAQPPRFRFAPHEQEAELCRRLQMLDEAHPVFFRPVLPLAATAGMKREPVESCSLRVDG